MESVTKRARVMPRAPALAWVADWVLIKDLTRTWECWNTTYDWRFKIELDRLGDKLVYFYMPVTCETCHHSVCLDRFEHYMKHYCEDCVTPWCHRVRKNMHDPCACKNVCRIAGVCSCMTASQKRNFLRELTRGEKYTIVAYASRGERYWDHGAGVQNQAARTDSARARNALTGASRMFSSV